MQIKLFGFKIEFRLHVVLICLALGAVIGSELFCNTITREGASVIGSTLDYAMNDGVHEERRKVLANLDDTYEKVQVPLPEGQLFFYANNKFSTDPECCKSGVSGIAGCACVTKEQREFINSHGGNASGSDGF
tara:strand:+ start:802 stop:1200 length:399 start_codon:yes stop_codon:yes gene_type:complete